MGRIGIGVTYEAQILGHLDGTARLKMTTEMKGLFPLYTCMALSLSIMTQLSTFPSHIS